MARTKKNALLTTTGETTVYTVPADTTATIGNMTFASVTSATTITCKFDDTLVLNLVDIQAKDTYYAKDEVIGHVLETGDTIKLTAGDANEVDYYISIFEESTT